MITKDKIFQAAVKFAEHRLETGYSTKANGQHEAFEAGATWAAWQHRWITVQEELPSIDDSVLVALSDGTVDHDWYDKEFNRWSKIRYDGINITHWRPVPVHPSK